MEINAKKLLGYLREVRKVSSGNILELNEKMKQKVIWYSEFHVCVREGEIFT